MNDGSETTPGYKQKLAIKPKRKTMLTWDENLKLDEQTSELPAWIDELLQAAGLSDSELDEMLSTADLFTQVKVNVQKLKEAESASRVTSFAFRLAQRSQAETDEYFPRCFVTYLQSPQVFFQVPDSYAKVKSVVLQNRGLHV